MEPRLRTTKEEKRMLQARTWFEEEEGGSFCNGKTCYTKTIPVSTMICFGTMKEVVGNHIVNLIDFDEIIAAAMETILKNKLMQERMSETV
jgi:hypothetical protein